MEPQNTDLAKSLAFNVLIGAGYYTVCSRYSLLTKEAIRSQMSLFALSTIVYNSLQTTYGTGTSLNQTDIIPIALLLVYKASTTSGKIHALSTSLLSGIQIATSKLSFSAPQQPHLDDHEKSKKEDRSWIDTTEIYRYIFPKKAAHPECYFANVFGGEIGGLNRIVVFNFNKSTPDQKHLFIPIHPKDVGETDANHFALIYINKDKHSIEFYDSKECDGRYCQMLCFSTAAYPHFHLTFKPQLLLLLRL